MKLFFLEPEVAGGIGKNTVYAGPNNVSHLHYEFEGWLGDELLETHPCFIVTEALAFTLENSGLSGISFAPVEIIKSEFFLEVQTDTTLPSFRRLIPTGSVHLEGSRFSNWTGEDFCNGQRYELVVSERALEVLKVHQVKYCDIHILNSEE